MLVILSVKIELLNQPKNMAEYVSEKIYIPPFLLFNNAVGIFANDDSISVVCIYCECCSI